MEDEIAELRAQAMIRQMTITMLTKYFLDLAAAFAVTDKRAAHEAINSVAPGVSVLVVSSTTGDGMLTALQILAIMAEFLGGMGLIVGLLARVAAFAWAYHALGTGAGLSA